MVCSNRTRRWTLTTVILAVLVLHHGPGVNHAQVGGTGPPPSVISRKLTNAQGKFNTLPGSVKVKGSVSTLGGMGSVMIRR